MTVRIPPRLAALAMMTLTLAGCAARVPWANPQLPQDQWDSDWSACKRQANAEVLGYQDPDRPSGPIDTYDRAEQKEQINASVATCMTGLGYLPAAKGN